MASTPRVLASQVLPPKMVSDIWTSNYTKALPISLSAFELSAVLPAVFYMFRFGQRRGRGQFLKTFAPEGLPVKDRRRKTTVDRVASVLSKEDGVAGFECDTTMAILGDLLLCFGLENAKRELGRDRQIQRIAPTHYLTSWVDLPDQVSDLRGVPEMLVAMLVNQRKGEYIERTDKGRFTVAASHDTNPLIAAFSEGIYIHGKPLDLSSDRFDEGDDGVGLDQLLMIRLAQLLRSAPDKAHGKEAARIPNQRPIAALAARHFSEDIRRFMRSYAHQIPRLALVNMLEACMSVGMMTILTSVMQTLFKWSESGCVTQENERPECVFVDCSTGVDYRLRMLAEQSFDDLLRRMEQLPTTLAVLRLLDYLARFDPKIKGADVETAPYAGEWLDLLGDLLLQRHPRATFVHDSVGQHCRVLADALEEDRPDLATLLKDEAGEPDAVRRFSIVLTEMMGANARHNLIKTVDSMVQANKPNGLAQKRRTTRGGGVGPTARSSREVRSVIFSDAVLEYLVHVHLLPRGNKAGIQRLSMMNFLEALRERYGFYVDVAPQGLSISSELLQLNRRTLERRLRDLGLLVGVNDAESMKRLRPRFQPRWEVQHA